MADFLNLTLKPQIQQQQGTNGVDKAQQNQQNQKTAQNDELKKTSVFTAEKNGMQAQNQQKQMLAGGDSGFEGVNAFGDSGFGDTVSFSTKATETNDTKTSTGGFTGKAGSTVNFANNDSEIKEIAEELGVEADENTVKNKLTSMRPEELVKLNGDILDKAKDLGLISIADIEKKIEKKDNAGNDQKGDNDPSKKIKFGTFTSGSEV